MRKDPVTLFAKVKKIMTPELLAEIEQEQDDDDNLGPEEEEARSVPEKPFRGRWPKQTVDWPDPSTLDSEEKLAKLYEWAFVMQPKIDKLLALPHALRRLLTLVTKVAISQK